jgi:hypothetical protein
MTTDSEQPMAERVSVGASVVTSDGELLGEVKELRGPYFKVAAPRRPDFWLQQSFTQRDAKGQVVAGFTKDELNKYEVKDIESDELGEGLNRTDASLLGESGTSTDTTTAP